MGGEEHVEHAALHEEHQHGRRRKSDTERHAERRERHRLRRQRGGGSCRDVTKPALQQIGEIRADDDGEQDGGAENGNCDEHLEGRLGDELNRHRRPVGRCHQRATFEEKLQVQGRI